MSEDVANLKYQLVHCRCVIRTLINAVKISQIHETTVVLSFSDVEDILAALKAEKINE